MSKLPLDLRFCLFSLGLLFSGMLLAAPPYPPQDEWDEVLSFYDNQGIAAEYVNEWRPMTTGRTSRVAGFHILPEISLNPFPGVHLDPDLAAKGMVSVVDFGADPTGIADSTEAIQAAVDFGRTYAMVTFFPEGTYTVSGTIKAWSLTRVGAEWRNGRIMREDFYVPVLVGSGAGANRPVIRLAPGTFPDFVENDRRFVVEFRNFMPPSTNTFTDEHGATRFEYEFPPVQLSATERERFSENTPDHIGPEFRGIDIEIAENNAGASGLRFPTAETSGVGDVEIRFLGDGHVGFQGPPGGGSASLNMTIIGGRIGLDTTNQNHRINAFPNSGTGAQPTPVLTGLTLINQTELAVRSQVRGTLVGVGWHIETELNGPVIMLRHAWYGDPFSSTFALIDSTIEYHTPTPFGNVVIGRHGDVEDRNRSFSLDNVYVRNAEHVYLANNLPDATFAANPVGWFHVKRLAYERQPRDYAGYELRERIWLDGALHGTWHFIGKSLADGELPPADLIARHLYQGEFPHFEMPGVVNVRDHGAVGDAVADDTAAFQAALAASAANGSHIVFVPRGYFKVSETLDLHPETKLIGLNRQWSVITTSQADGVFGGAANRSDYPEGIPLIRTADSATADTVIAHLRLAVGYPIKTHNGWWTGGGPPDFEQDGAIPYEESMVEVYPLQWRSGGTSVVRECMFNPRGEFNFHFNLYDEETYEGSIFLNPLILMEGNAGGRWYGFHFHSYYAFGPEAALIRIQDNLNPIHFYHLHAQHNTALNLIDLVNTRYVSIYGIKTEHHKTLLRSINSNNLRIFGHGGIATPAPGGKHYLFEDTDDFLISAIGDEVQFWNDSSHGSGWSIMYFTNFENYNLFIDRQNGVDTYPPFNERPTLYQRGHPQAGSPVGPLVTHTVSLSSEPNGSLTGPLLQEIPDRASTALVTAVPDTGYSFAGWSGDYEGWENPLYLRDVSNDLTLTAHFQPANEAPVVTILYPTQGTILYDGETVVLEGTAWDAEDGDLTAQAVWSSNQDGVLGSGTGVEVSHLSLGLHQIRLSATDSAGQTTLAEALVWVEALPVVIPSTTGTSPGNNTPWMPTRLLADGLTYGGLIRGSGLTGQSTNDVFEVRQGSPEGGTDLAYVLANDHYVGLTVTPDTGMELNLDGATFRFAVSRENNAGATLYSVFTSVDGFTLGAEIGTVEHPGPATSFITMSYVLEGSQFNNITGPVEIRIYPHNSTWGRKLQFQDFALFGGTVTLEGDGPPPPPTYTVGFSAGSGGSLSGDLNQTVTEGDATTAVTAEPDEGYAFVNWTWDGGGSSLVNPLSILNVTQDLSVTAHFEEIHTGDEELWMPSIFQSSMVLQRGQPIAIFGKANPGETITATFNDQNKAAIADGSGDWILYLDSEEASTTGRTLTVQGAADTLTFSDVLVGEVWLLSGQSNMARSLAQSNTTPNAEADRLAFEDEVTANNLTHIRMFRQNLVESETPADDVDGGVWSVVSSSNLNAVRNFSGLGLYFGQRLYEDTGVPVGLVAAAWGGRQINRFISAEYSENDRHVKQQADASSNSSRIYNKMIFPLAPYTMKGSLWYQGESDVSFAWIYYKQLSTLIVNWRDLWGQDEFHFGIVQLANWQANDSDQNALEQQWDLRQAQDYVDQAVENTFLASFVDAELYSGDLIHPPVKKVLGERLALRAQDEVYGLGAQPRHPRYAGHSISGNEVTVYFDTVGGGLTTTDGQAPAGFHVAESDRVWVAANATIVGDTMVVSAPGVANPVAVTYHTRVGNGMNLYTTDGWPVLPFASDRWAPNTGWTPTRQEGKARAVLFYYPVDTQVFASGDSITLAADATIRFGDTHLEMQQVEFFHGSTKIGEAAGSPAIFTWTGVPAGTYTLTARSKSSPDDVEEISETVTITILEAGDANVPPVASITAPMEGAIFAEGDSVTFTGTGTDDEDGDVTASAVWLSSVNGQIGTGGSFATSTLSPGFHLITLTVSDSAGATGTDTVSITVNAADSGGSYFFETDFSGTALSRNLPWTKTSSLASGLTSSGWVYGAGMKSEDDWSNAEIIDNALGFVVGDRGGRTLLADAVSENVYLGLTLSGTDLDLNGATVTFAGTLRTRNSNPREWAIMTSVGGFAAGNQIHTALLDHSEGNDGVSQEFSFTLPASGYDNLSNIEIRIYPYNGEWANNPAPSLDTFRISNANVGGNTPPSVTITAPADNTTVTQGENVTFSGTATDAEDDDAALLASATWTSSLDGLLGTGGSVSTTTLSVGTHTITFAVTDSGVLSDSDHITLTVVDGVSPDSYTMVIDFGKVDQETSAPGYWNNVTGAGDWANDITLSPSLIRHADGVPTGISLKIERVDPGGRAGIGGLDLTVGEQDGDAAFTVSGNLPASAQRDIAFFSADGRAQFVFENLDDTKIYQLEFQTLHTSTTAAANWTVQPGTAHEQVRLISRNKGAAHYSPVQVFENIQTDGEGRIILRSAGDIAQNINALELTASTADTPPPPPPTHTVTFTAGTGGSLTGNLHQTVTEGDASTAVTAVPDEGYTFVNWTWTGDNASTDNPLTITNVMEDLTVTAHFEEAVPPPPATAIFDQDFSASSVVGDYIGSADHLFDFLGTANTDNRATLSINNGRLRNTIAYTDDDNTSQVSAARATRRTDLPVEENFAVVSARFLMAPDQWPTQDHNTTYASFAIGQNFRGGVFNPAVGDGNGPQFASLNLQALATPDTFRTTGAGGNSSQFTVTPSGGAYALDLVFAANAGAEAQNFPSPTGEHTVQAGRVSIWINGILHIDNTATNVTAADIVNVSFSTGSGTATDYAGGVRWNGYYEIDDVLVQTVSNFSVTEEDPYDLWVAENGIEGQADDLTNGIPNLLRYALGGTADSPAAALQPIVETNTDTLTLRFERIADPALHYEVWASNDLVNWGASPIWSSTGVENNAGEIVVSDPVLMSQAPRRFLRLVVWRE